jgi:transcriptional antiterminator NusG
MFADEVRPGAEVAAADDAGVSAPALPGSGDDIAADALTATPDATAEEEGRPQRPVEEAAPEARTSEVEETMTEVTEIQAEEMVDEAKAEARVAETQTEEMVEEAKAEARVAETQTEEMVEEAKAEARVAETQTEEMVTEAQAEAQVAETQAEETVEEAKAEAQVAEIQAEETVEEAKAETRVADTQTEETAEQVETETGVSEPQDDRAWYVIHCYSGYENKVKHNLEQRIETMQMQDQIFQVVVPTEDEMEVRDGKRRVVERRVFPGYILVQMVLNNDSWYVVRNTPGATGFVGMGNVPTPLRPEEVQAIMKRMEAEAPKIKVTFKSGQKVRIIDGPFNEFIGMVDEIDMERAKVRVMVSFFGRETPVELDFLQVEKA